jgi:hypothetical protein
MLLVIIFCIGNKIIVIGDKGNELVPEIDNSPKPQSLGFRDGFKVFMNLNNQPVLLIIIGYVTKNEYDYAYNNKNDKGELIFDFHSSKK